MGYPNSLMPSIQEVDLTNIVPSLSTTAGGFAGIFNWGPVNTVIPVTNQTSLVQMFGQPKNTNYETFYTAWNFLAYGNNLKLVRAANTSGTTPNLAFTGQVNTSVTSTNILVAANSSINVANLINVGMYVIESENANIVSANFNTVVNSVNSTAIVLSSNVSVNTAITLHFGNLGTSYSALATQPNSYVANLVNQIVPNENAYTALQGNFDTNVAYIAKWPGLNGNSLRVSQCDSPLSYTSNVNLVGISNTYAMNGSFSVNIGSNIGNIIVTPGTGGAISDAQNFVNTLVSEFSLGDQVLVGNSAIGLQYLQIGNISAVTSNSSAASVLFTFNDPYRLHTNYTTTNLQRYWEFFGAIGVAPGVSNYMNLNGNSGVHDELHIVVVDDEGSFTGTPGTILESYKSLSRATDATNIDGTNNYYASVLNSSSQYIWFANDRPGATSAKAVSLKNSIYTAPADYIFQYGSDGYSESNAPLSVVANGFNLFKDKNGVDISLIMQGKPIGGTTVVNGQTINNFQLANYIIDNIVTTRMDCIALITPDLATVLNNFGNEETNLINWRGALHSTSYAVMDSGYKYQSDTYNNVSRWVPLNGDIAGLCVRTDYTNDAWWSPAGTNRGQIKNIIKLAYNPGDAMDNLYQNNINPVIALKNRGIVLFGDKTLQAKASAFDRINVRRLFITIEKAVAAAAIDFEFEFNDTFTQIQVRNLINPYLNNVKSRRGVTDYYVVCDSTNNTPQVVDSDQMLIDVYVKPNRSINFIGLRFIATPSGIQFSQVIGQF